MNYQEKKQLVSKTIKRKEVERKIKVITDNTKRKCTNPRSYWRTLKRTNNRNNCPITLKDPNDPSRLVTDPKEIKELLTKYWSTLSGNSSNSQNDCINAYHQEQTINDSALNTIEFDLISVSAAIKKMKTGKACGVDMIAGEFVKYGGNNLTSSLLNIFQHCYSNEVYPTPWLQGIVKPLHKAGCKSILDNYRGITVTSVIYKLYASVIERQMMEYLENEELLGDLQGAFRKGRRPEDHILTLKGLCQARKVKKKKTFLAFIDVSKAFDTVDREQLFCHLWKIGIQSKCWRTLHHLYKNVTAKVLLSDISSDWFKVSNGVKQGCILSPTLFNLVMKNLQSMLEQHNLGIPFQNRILPALLFADDVVLLSENAEQLQKMLNIVHSFGQKWNLNFSEKKSKVMVIGKRIDKMKIWRIGDLCIEEVNEYKYLGIYITRNLKDSYHIKSHLKHKLNKLKGFMAMTLSNHLDINRVDFGSTIWHSIIMPALTYGCSVWFDSKKYLVNMMSSFQYSCAKTVMKLRCQPAKCALLSDLGWLPIKHHMDNYRISYLLRLKSDMSNKLVSSVFHELKNLNINESYCSNIKSILISRGLDFVFEAENMNKPNICNAFKQIGREMHHQLFIDECQTMSSLELYSLCKKDTFMANYLKDQTDFKGAQLKFKARTGCLPIETVLEMRKQSDGICKRCQTGEKDTISHLMLHCDRLSKYRDSMLENIEHDLAKDNKLFLWTNFVMNTDVFKLKFLLGDHGDIFDKHVKMYLKNVFKDCF